MGNTPSKTKAHAKLAAELPHVKKMEYDENWNYIDASMKVFASSRDKDQFIHAVVAVATANGALDLAGCEYKLFYTRRERTDVQAAAAHDEDLTETVASIAALREGVIVAKIEPGKGGADQREAFLALRRDVEVKLGRVLQDVPSAAQSGSAAAGPSVPSDLPPSYQSSAAICVAPMKEKA